MNLVYKLLQALSEGVL